MLVEKYAADTVRKFDSGAEAAQFFHLENADPPRLHYRQTVDKLSLSCSIYGAVNNGVCSINGRDDGWDTVDSEGWYRFRYCRPTNMAELVIPQREHFVGFPGDLGDTRRTLAFTNNGRIYLFEDSWREHEKGGDRTIRVVCEDGDPGPIDLDFSKLQFVGYSWFRDEQYAGTDFVPYFRSMLTRPPEVNWERKRNPLYPVQPPPENWLPFVHKFARHRLHGGPPPPPDKIEHDRTCESGELPMRFVKPQPHKAKGGMSLDLPRSAADYKATANLVWLADTGAS